MSWLTPDEAAAFAREGDGRGVSIAVLDSGAELGHPALSKMSVRDEVSFETRGGMVQIGDDASDALGHGTAVAGMIHRLVPAAEIGVFRIMGRQSRATADVVHRAAQRAWELGYDIVHCSFGAPASAAEVMLYKSWVDALYLAGVHVVAAGSNSGFSVPEWPAAFPSVVAVGARADGGDGLQRIEGSLTQFAENGAVADAPWLGSSQRSVVGSSFAAPRVTAMVARIVAERQGVPPAVLKEALLASAQS